MTKLKTGAPETGAPAPPALVGMVMAALVLLFALHPAGPVLVIRVAGHQTYRWVAEPGQLLIYHYVHSLERVSVFEYLRIEERGLRVVAIRQQPVGVLPPGSGEGLMSPASAALLPKLELSITPDERQSLTLGSRRVDLSVHNLGTAVEARVARAPWLWFRWRRFSS